MNETANETNQCRSPGEGALGETSMMHFAADDKLGHLICQMPLTAQTGKAGHRDGHIDDRSHEFKQNALYSEILPVESTLSATFALLFRNHTE